MVDIALSKRIAAAEGIAGIKIVNEKMSVRLEKSLFHAISAKIQ